MSKDEKAKPKTVEEIHADKMMRILSVLDVDGNKALSNAELGNPDIVKLFEKAFKAGEVKAEELAYIPDIIYQVDKRRVAAGDNKEKVHRDITYSDLLEVSKSAAVTEESINDTLADMQKQIAESLPIAPEVLGKAMEDAKIGAMKKFQKTDANKDGKLSYGEMMEGQGRPDMLIPLELPVPKELQKGQDPAK